MSLDTLLHLGSNITQSTFTLSLDSEDNKEFFILVVVWLILGNKWSFVIHRKKSLARCGKCKKAFYCNVKCQVGSEFPSDLAILY